MFIRQIILQVPKSNNKTCGDQAFQYVGCKDFPIGLKTMTHTLQPQKTTKTLLHDNDLG